LEATAGKAQESLNALAHSAAAAGWEMIGLTNATAEQGRAFREKHGVPYDMYTCDQTELKIVVRSNPGLVLIQNGVVLDKWAWRDFPTSVEDIEAR
jgi:peroxiredoxin